MWKDGLNWVSVIPFCSKLIGVLTMPKIYISLRKHFLWYLLCYITAISYIFAFYYMGWNTIRTHIISVFYLQQYFIFYSHLDTNTHMLFPSSSDTESNDLLHISNDTQKCIEGTSNRLITNEHENSTTGPLWCRQWPADSPNKWPVVPRAFPCHDIINEWVVRIQA